MTATAIVRPAVISEQDVRLEGTLELPASARGMVVFAHGTGSSLLSARNQAVAAVLHDAGLGTLLLDLLTEDETRERANEFDIQLLGGRLIGATEWLELQPESSGLPIGFFGAGTGAAAALVAACRQGGKVQAVVSCGGRPDLAGPWLGGVRAATLLIAGGRDTAVLGLNRLALERMACARRLVVVPGATRLFEELGALEEVARLAAQWFVHYVAMEHRHR